MRLLLAQSLAPDSGSLPGGTAEEAVVGGIAFFMILFLVMVAMPVILGSAVVRFVGRAKNKTGVTSLVEVGILDFLGIMLVGIIGAAIVTGT